MDDSQVDLESRCLYNMCLSAWKMIGWSDTAGQILTLPTGHSGQTGLKAGQ